MTQLQHFPNTVIVPLINTSYPHGEISPMHIWSTTKFIHQKPGRCGSWLFSCNLTFSKTAQKQIKRRKINKSSDNKNRRKRKKKKEKKSMEKTTELFHDRKPQSTTTQRSVCVQHRPLAPPISYYMTGRWRKSTKAEQSTGWPTGYKPEMITVWLLTMVTFFAAGT